ncbi:HEAT repeat domain-containing protein [Gemmata sp. JC717]|uniref:HEAT repeat domain-containing protein n=1 Tax=Gemmata algarum TaxID=2975278 RepID=A0ABU5F177_9BACT|nr:HEAT repeat domain-containing protein [Gemmata algarum]MDY3551620.1 HEAT repeat domain-containing protein [Gemmata algarum]MDY3560507.1 HEAT repeat domain-containing protein [Gemmata algarum]
MRGLFVLAALCAVAPAVRADEVDDALAKKLGAVVRDPRHPLRSRVEAANMLGKLGPLASAATGDLVAVLERLRGREQEPLQEAVVDALGQIGAPARSTLPALARAANRSADIDLALRRARESILAAQEVPRDVELLAQQLLSRDASSRVRAAKALADLGVLARGAAPALTLVLRDPDDDVRRGAIAALRLIQPNQVSEPLVRAIAIDLKSPDANARLIAARTLGTLGAPAAAAALDLDALRNDPDPDVRRAAVVALNRIPPPPPPAAVTNP